MKQDIPSSLCTAQPLSAMLCFDVYATNLAFNRVYKPFLDPLGITYPQYLVLIVLWQQDGQSVGQIGRALGLESSTLTPLLKRLEAAGLVLRQRDTEDERRVCIDLTPHAQFMRDQAQAVPACVAQRVGLTPAETSTLQDLLIRLRASLVQTTQRSSG